VPGRRLPTRKVVFDIPSHRQRGIPTNKTWGAPEWSTLLADLPLDQSDGGIDSRIYIQLGGVEQYGVVGAPQGCARTSGIALVTAPDECQNVFEGDGLAAGAEL
jgi:hypothetical protein